MKLKEITELTVQDISRMSTAELEAVLRTGKQILLRRQRRQKAAKAVAPIWKQHTSPYRMKTKGLTRNEAVAALIEQRQLLTSPTTTMKGQAKWNRRVSSALTGVRGADNLSDKQLTKIFTLYGRIQEMHPGLLYKIDYREVLKTITESVTEHPRRRLESVDKLIKKALEETEGVEYSDEEWEYI